MTISSFSPQELQVTERVRFTFDNESRTESAPQAGHFRREEAPMHHAVNWMLSMRRALPRREAVRTTKCRVSGFAGASVFASRTLK